MEASGVVLRQTPCFSSSSSLNFKEFKPSSGSVLFDRRAGARIRVPGFRDSSHVQYYSSSKIKSSCEPSSSMEAVLPEMKVFKNDGQERSMMTICTKDKASKSNTKKKLKKQLKLLKGLSMNLSNFSEMGFGLDSDQVKDKANIISDAADILLQRIEKLKAEEKEQKKKKKEEKARMKAAQMQNKHNGCEESSGSSSSSESSDSECGEVVDMNSLKQYSQTNQIASQTVLEQATSPPLTPSTPVNSLTCVSEATSTVNSLTCVSEATSTRSSDSAMCTEKKRIEVCMGGKCRKSGAAALLQEFERVVGIEGAVSGCKCMGKCGDGPNARVLNGGGAAAADDSVRIPANPLCIGVGLEDVHMIVANFLGDGGVGIGANA